MYSFNFIFCHFNVIYIEYDLNSTSTSSFCFCALTRPVSMVNHGLIINNLEFSKQQKIKLNFIHLLATEKISWLVCHKDQPNIYMRHLFFLYDWIWYSKLRRWHDSICLPKNYLVCWENETLNLLNFFCGFIITILSYGKSHNMLTRDDSLQINVKGSLLRN